jgi:hypothetical protein
METNPGNLEDSTIKGYNAELNYHILEQYKIYVEMADRVSARRSQANAFYISIISGLIALFSLVPNKNVTSSPPLFLLFLVAFLGLSLCFFWYINIQSYKQLNSLKFKVIHEIENHLPFSCYQREWEILKSLEKEQPRSYIRLTSIEKNIPFLFSIPFFILLLYVFIVFLNTV